jgi:hypothetical protein
MHYDNQEAKPSEAPKVFGVENERKYRVFGADAKRLYGKHVK